RARADPGAHERRQDASDARPSSPRRSKRSVERRENPPYRTDQPAGFRKNVHIVGRLLTSRDIHHRLRTSRPSRGAFMRRREGGAGPAPAGVVRSCTPGRTPEEPRQLLRAGPGPGTVERESGKSRWRAGQARSFFWRLLWRATPPHVWGNGKRDGRNPKPDQTWGW